MKARPRPGSPRRTTCSPRRRTPTRTPDRCNGRRAGASLPFAVHAPALPAAPGGALSMTAVAAVLAAVAVFLCLVPARRSALLFGLVLLAVAEGVLLHSLVPAHDLERAVASPARIAALVVGLGVVSGIA